jgi:poly-gamma-glutamate synthase PgsB/CapB
MMFLLMIYCVGCVLLLLAGVIEQRNHLRNLRSIPTRVVVNGIRGKSSITRLCAGALRGGGLVTVAKTTGTAARLIAPDGEEEPVYRKFGLANIIEQIGIVRRAAAHRPDALVIECMAVLPDLQEVNERKLIQSTVCVICNVREDHLAEMGPTLDHIARSLARSMPLGGICITAERDRIGVLREEAARRNCRLVQVDPESVSDSEIERFRWIAFKENVAIAIAVAELSGIGREAALAGMVAARPDPGTVAVSAYAVRGCRISFANVFAANDPESTLMNIELLDERRLIERPLNVVINCRSDRMERNGQMGELMGRLQPDRILLIGEQTRSARVTVPTDLADRVANLGGALEFNALLDSMSYGDDLAASLVAVGNIHGQGEVLLDRIRALPTAAPAPPIARPRRHPRRPAVPASPPETAEAAVLSAVRRIREQRSPDSSPTQPLPVVAAASRGSRWR